METLDKLFITARDDIGSFKFHTSIENRLNAMNSIGAIEGYLKAAKEFEKIDNETYVTKFDDMTKLYDKIKV